MIQTSPDRQATGQLSPQAQKVMEQVLIGRQEAAQKKLTESGDSLSPQAQERLKSIAGNTANMENKNV